MNRLQDTQDEKLKENLLAISKQLLKYRQLRYNDDIVKTLKDIYCIKEITDQEQKEPPFSLKNLARGFLAPFSRGRTSNRYRGIDGKVYYQEDLLVWSQVKPLLLKFREKLNNNKFRVNW